jgi:hypothetical protein
MGGLNLSLTLQPYSLARLGVDHIDIYRMARLDPKVPIEDTIGAIADFDPKSTLG